MWWQSPCHPLFLPPSLRGIAELGTLFTWLSSYHTVTCRSRCSLIFLRQWSFVFRKPVKDTSLLPHHSSSLKKREREKKGEREKVIEVRSQWDTSSISVLNSRYCPQRLLLLESWPIKISISFAQMQCENTVFNWPAQGHTGMSSGAGSGAPAL